MLNGHVDGGNKRRKSFARNQKLEGLLHDLNGTLWSSERQLLDEHGAMTHPLILVMGAMRSGTTLMMQWLANTGLVAYPSNLLARFYGAPIIGAKIQKLLTDPQYQYRDELIELSGDVGYASHNGKTSGALGPNEFWYFWRRFFSDAGRDVWSDQELREGFDSITVYQEMSGLINFFDKPFAAKGAIFNFNIPFINQLFDRMLFICMTRDRDTHIESVLDARRRQLGDENAWYSFKIPHYDEIKNLPAREQVAAQLLSIDSAMLGGLKEVAKNRQLVVSYEDFCANPNRVFEQICERLGRSSQPYLGPSQFSLSRQA